MTCHRFDGRVQTTEAWLKQHRNHGDLGQEAHPHPSGKWIWLTCECGAKHLHVVGEEADGPKAGCCSWDG